jgi:hypothetical protein
MVAGGQCDITRCSSTLISLPLRALRMDKTPMPAVWTASDRDTQCFEDNSDNSSVFFAAAAASCRTYTSPYSARTAHISPRRQLSMSHRAVSRLTFAERNSNRVCASARGTAGAFCDPDRDGSRDHQRSSGACCTSHIPATGTHCAYSGGEAAHFGHTNAAAAPLQDQTQQLPIWASRCSGCKFLGTQQQHLRIFGNPRAAIAHFEFSDSSGCAKDS